MAACKRVIDLCQPWFTVMVEVGGGVESSIIIARLLFTVLVQNVISHTHYTATVNLLLSYLTPYNRALYEYCLTYNVILSCVKSRNV